MNTDVRIDRREIITYKITITEIIANILSKSVPVYPIILFNVSIILITYLFLNRIMPSKPTTTTPIKNKSLNERFLIVYELTRSVCEDEL